MGELGDYWRAARNYPRYGHEEDPSPARYPPDKPYPCPVCGKKMISKQAIVDHVRGKTRAGDREHRTYWRKHKYDLQAAADAAAEEDGFCFL